MNNSESSASVRGGEKATEIILQGIVGSTAYGLDTPESDKDYLGVYMADPVQLLGWEASKVLNSTIVTSDPDSALHELYKFCGNAAKCNPTMLELLYLPGYTIATEAGRELVDLRYAFLSEERVRKAYAGYVTSQADRLLRRSQDGQKGFDPKLAKRTHKHGRHCYRLLIQGRQLLSEGIITVDVSEYRDKIWEAGDLAESDPEKFQEFIMDGVAAMESRIKSNLPTMPDYARITGFLYEVRKDHILRSEINTTRLIYRDKG